MKRVNTTNVTLAPGRPGRWQLEADLSGLADQAAMLQTTSDLTYLWNMYTFIQGFIIFVLALSMIRLIGTQPRLAVIPASLFVIIPDICHLIVVALVVCSLLAMIFVLIIGPNNQQVGSFSHALEFLATVLVTGNELTVFEGLYDGQYSQLQLAVVNTVHALMFFLLLTIKAMFLTVIIAPFSLLIRRGRKLPSVVEDVESLIYWRIQQVHRTSWLNSFLLEKIGSALKKNTGSRFVKLKRFLSKQASRRLTPGRLLSIRTTASPGVDRIR